MTTKQQKVPYIYSPEEAVTFCRLGKRFELLSPEPGTVVSDSGGLKVTVRSNHDGEVYHVSPGRVWNSASLLHREGLPG